MAAVTPLSIERMNAESLSNEKTSPDEEGVAPKTASLVFNVLNAIAFVADVVVSCGVFFGWFGMPSLSETTTTYQTLITPNKWTIACTWVVILAAQLVWVVMQLLPRHRDSPLVTSVGWNYVGACVADMVWKVLLCLQWILFLPFVAMVVCVVCLLRIVRAQQDDTKRTPISFRQYLCFKFLFVLWFGCAIVGTIVVFNVWIMSLGASSNSRFGIALASLSAMFILAWFSSDLSILLVLAWSMIGIYVELLNPNYVIEGTYHDSQVSTVRIVALGTYVVILALILWRGYSLYRKHRSSIAKVDITASAEEGDSGNYVSLA